MKSIKFVVREYEAKDGRKFAKASCKGQYLPLVMAEVEKYYTVKFTKSSLAPLPQKEGIYEVSFEDDGIWIDNRAEFVAKDIVRINAVRVVFSKNLEAKHE